MDPDEADAAGHTRKGRDIRKMRTRYTLINMVVNVGGQLMNQVLLFGAVMVVLHRNAPEFNQLKGRVTAIMKRRES